MSYPFFKQTATVKGTGPAHVALNTEFNIIFISNYGSGSVVVYSIDPVTGDIGAEPLYFEEYERGSGVVPDRQEASHAHGSFFFRDNAYVADLGGDIIWHYKALCSEAARIRQTTCGPFRIRGILSQPQGRTPLFRSSMHQMAARSSLRRGPATMQHPQDSGHGIWLLMSCATGKGSLGEGV